jgi:hypothetical protein
VHGAIVDAIAAGDANLATHAMLRHFERTSRYVEQAIDKTFHAVTRSGRDSWGGWVWLCGWGLMFVKVFRSEILADFRRLGISLVALGVVPGWPVPVPTVLSRPGVRCRSAVPFRLGWAIQASLAAISRGVVTVGGRSWPVDRQPRTERQLSPLVP